MGEKPMTPSDLIEWHLSRADTADANGLQRYLAFHEQAAACIREMVEWRPIETAPMDGTEVVAWDGSDNIICHWHGSVAGWVTHWETVSGYDVGWNTVHPSHWLPLPPAPGAEA